MTTLPETVIEQWDKREGPAVLTTVDNNSTPNSVYVTCLERENDSTFIIADNYFDKTRVNIENGTIASLLFITKDRKAIQIKGDVKRYSNGASYESMKKWLDPKYPGKAAVVFTVKEIFQGSKKLA